MSSSWLVTFLFKTLLTIYFVDVAKCLGQVEAVFKTLSNPGGQLVGGSCKAGRCRIKMKVSFLQPSNANYKSDYILFEDHLTFDQSGPGALNDKGAGVSFDNPINITASGKEKLKEFGLRIEVYDYSGTAGKLLMVDMEHSENVTTGVVYDRTLTQGQIEMEISFRVICEVNYYFDCSVHCIPQDDNLLGHYTCHPVTGAKVCRVGWTGDICQFRVCPQPEVLGGSIVSPERAMYQENDTVTVECGEDYHLNPHLESGVLTCESEGRWSFPPDTVCREGGCGGCDRLREPVHGRLTYRSHNSCGNADPGSTVKVTCYPRYVALVQYPGLVCGQDERWRTEEEGVDVEEGAGVRLIDCLPDGEGRDEDSKEDEDALKRHLAQSAAIIASAIMFVLGSLCCLYGVLYRRRDKEKRRVSPRRKSYVPEEARQPNRTVKCTGIGGSHTLKGTMPEVQKSGSIKKPGYYNQGFEADFDYDF